MRLPRNRVALLSSVLLAGACAGYSGPAPMRTVEAGWRQEGEASWYGPGFDGKRTASGEVYDMDDLTAAHRELPFGSLVRVVNLDNGLETQVRINDRGPFARGRVLDLSRAAAREIDMLASGTARVRIEVLSSDAPPPAGDAPADQVAIPTSCTLVQVGAYRERRNAAEMVRRLEARGEPVRELQGGDGITRVLIGPYGSEAETRLILERYDGLLKPCGG
ncbi:MAG: septal ring lytic transglycosylase RlpA family protein [Gemmatimonadales bacterium]|jgi:rare lipoprotein A